ncbi:hypothetical protein VTH82DRAFT_6059 [Thermothelomyces myriococcoides]
MSGLQRAKNILPRATPALIMRTCVARRSRPISTLRAEQKTSGNQQWASSPATSATTPPDLSRNRGVYGAYRTSHHAAFSEGHGILQQADGCTRALYTTQIYHGQARPHSRRGMHHQHQPTPAASSEATTTSGPSGGSIKGPMTGFGTGVGISAQMFGSAVKGNPTESEAYVAADRAEEDPLPAGLHHTIRLGAGDAAPRPTESEEDVVADRGAAGEDPLGRGRKEGEQKRR